LRVFPSFLASIVSSKLASIVWNRLWFYHLDFLIINQSLTSFNSSSNKIDNKGEVLLGECLLLGEIRGILNRHTVLFFKVLFNIGLEWRSAWPSRGHCRGG
jgi:hypothetical protein